MSLKNYLSSLNITYQLCYETRYNPNDLYNKLEHMITTAMDACMPRRRLKFNKYKHKKSSWISFGIINSIKFRDKLYKDLKKTHPSNFDYQSKKQNLKVYNNILKKLIIEAKQNYYGKQFEASKNNSQKTWNTIKEIIGRNPQSLLPDHFMINERVIRDKNIIANSFNNYFGNIGTQMAKSIPNINSESPEKYLTKPVNTQFQFHNINEGIVRNVIKNLKPKRSSGHDGLSMFLLKQLADLLAEPLAYIINCSLELSVFPEKLKIAKIIPIHKKENPHLIENYRPISLLPAISKIFEKVVHEQLFSYFTENKLFFEHQYGFRKSHSTEHAVLELIDKLILGIDNGNTPITVFIDLSKAFDTLNHQILLCKLKYYGAHKKTLAWFDSYLSNRKHYTELDTDIKSSHISSQIGVPQGSILGPLLFTIYMNDFHLCSKFFEFILYADDTTLYNPLSNLHHRDVSLHINQELNHVYEWLCINKLSLNIKKTKHIMFHSPKKKIQELQPKLVINDINIEQVKDFNFLGITIEEHLNWKLHIDKISKKISRAIGIMNKLKQQLPTFTLKILYDSLIQCHINYGILSWGFNTTNIFKLQKKSIRVITKVKYNAHTDPLFKNHDILKAQDIFKLNILKFYYNYKHHELPAFFYLSISQPDQQYTLIIQDIIKA